MLDNLNLLGIFATAFGLSFALTPIARSIACHTRLVDRPDGRRKLHGRAIPVTGGLAILFALLGAVDFGLYRVDPAVLGFSSQSLLGLLLGGVLICAVGVADDCGSLRGRHKLLGQLVAVGVVIAFGVRIDRVHVFGMDQELGMLAIPFTTFFLLGAINSLNLLDGMDGLLSTVGLLICLALGVMALHTGHMGAALVALALSGALLGFMCFNFPPASIFLGDSGSMLIGLTVGVLAIQSSLKGPATLALAAPAALLILPIFDTTAAIIRRKLTGRSVYTTDRGHLHHCLLRSGLSVRTALLLVAGLGLVSVGGALGSVAFENEWLAALSAALVVGILMATRLFGHAEFVLLGQRANRVLRSFLRGPNRDQPSELEVRLQGTADWKGLWQTILENAAGLNLRRVRLDVNCAGNQRELSCKMGTGPRRRRAIRTVACRDPALGERPGDRQPGGGRPHAGRCHRGSHGGSGPADRVLRGDRGSSDPRGIHTAVDPRACGPGRGRQRHGSAGRRNAPLNGRPLRVCHLGKYYPPAPGGMETHLQTLARAQAALGAKVHVICVNHVGRGTGATEEWDGPVRVTRLSRLVSLSGLDVCPGIPTALRRLRHDPPDLIHLHTPNPTMLLPLAMLPPGPPVVVTHHSDIVRQKWLRHLHNPFERRVYHRAAMLLSDSPPYIEGSEVLQRYHRKVRTLPLGIDLAPYQKPSPRARSIADELRRRHGVPLWLCVGRLVYYKGLTVALEMLRHTPGKLLVIGTGPLERELREIAGTLGVADRVLWHGNAGGDELVGAYQAATALWFPSVARSEGFGLVQVEAMASRCPVLNTAIPSSGVSWVSLHEKTGLTVPVGESPALAAAARRLVEEAGLRERLAEAAGKRAVSEFGHRIMGERSLEDLPHRTGQNASAGCHWQLNWAFLGRLTAHSAHHFGTTGAHAVQPDVKDQRVAIAAFLCPSAAFQCTNDT